MRPHTTTKSEIDALRAVVARDLQDASLPGLSDDRRFATAYNAALQAAKLALACAGYRVVGQGHHQTTFEAVELALGAKVAPYAAYFETCRRKRNAVDYDLANVISRAEADELVQKAGEFAKHVENWITVHHQHLIP